MNTLLPRLPGPACETIVRSFLENDVGILSEFDASSLPDSVRYAATGGTPARAAQLASFRTDVVALARKHGFGADTGRSSMASFDAEAAAFLAQAQIFSSGEALRDDVWSFVAAVILPDVVRWRFGSAIERYTGGIRNTFQRLWMRGRALDRGFDHQQRWGLLHELTEDALVQITERPSIGSDHGLSVAVAEAWLRASSFHGKSAMEDIMRRAILRIRIQNEIRSLIDLPYEDLQKFLDGAFGVVTPVMLVVANEEADSDVKLQEKKADYEQARLLQRALSQPNVSLGEAVNLVLSLASQRSWLSPKSRAALSELSSGRRGIDRSERNALSYLLGRLHDANLLRDEVSIIRSAIDEL